MTDEVKPPLTTTTSILPAMAVLIVAVVTLAVFLAINFIANPRVTTSSTTLPVVVGGLGPSSAHLLAGCAQPDNPPVNISSALLVPSATSVVSAAAVDNAGAGEFDCTAAFLTPATSAKVLGFYRGQLEVRGWDLFSRGSSHGQPQLLFQKTGSDTFYWVVGITVTQTAGTTTHWSYRIYQNSGTV
ncbi:MAG: hypothetical protein ACRDV0_09795 [Acidimicrobiales bacterium]